MSDSQDDKFKELLKFQISRKVTNLYKEFFFILEDLSSEGYIIPESKYQLIRKRILDQGNSCNREIDELLEKLDVRLK